MAATSSSSSSSRRSENALFKISGSTSSSTTQKQQHYDVFINHRGPDVKLNLASPIYHVLDLLGVKAFFDQEELELADPIPQAIGDAIGNALIHIAIFSKRYAESPWCLEELSLILETGSPIIPVFYCVKPGDLKWGAKELYGEAFSKHESRYDQKMLEKWKSALHQASLRIGSEFEDNGDLGVLLKQIVNRVQQEIKNKRVPDKAAAYTVGLDDAVQGFESIIGSAPPGVQVVGIFGMGGGGKTTLARELYNQKFNSFDKCCFLSEVKDASLTELQNKLSKDILHYKNIPGMNASILNGRLNAESPRVLIVLDDFDRRDELENLLSSLRASLGSGSLIIVTARDSDVLKKCDISLIYKMPELDQRHAEELFCWHAFKGASPPDNFKDLINEFVSACDSLPLSLKVIGERLYKEPEGTWISELEKIPRLLPDKIKRTLMLSYDALDPEEQEIFLDVACFFAGEKKNMANAVWRAARWSSLESLEKKCLVEVDKQNRIRMHNHLRHLGRDIASDRSPYRLWKDEEVGQIMMRCAQHKIIIRGIMAATTQFVACSAHNEFPEYSAFYEPPSDERMDLSRLQLLVVAKNYFTPEFATLSKALVWLRLFDFQRKHLPGWLSLTKLRVLELYGASRLRKLWKDNAQPPEELREVTITATEGTCFRNFPSQISGLEHLTKIALISYHGTEFLFEKLPDDFCNLRSLEHLELRYCKKLSKLPTHFGKLTELRHLDLCSCQDLRRLPGSFKELKNLNYLDLSGCERLSPVDISENMVKLEKLYFSGLAKLEELTKQIAEQKSLIDLRLERTALLSVPDYIGELSKLETLVIGSPHLTGFPTSLGNLSSLTRLEIIRCINLQALPESVGCLKFLEYLVIKACEKIRSLPEGLRQLTNLQSLKIIDCPIAKLNFGLGSSSLCKLKVIHLKGTDVMSLSISQDCCLNLETLQLEQNYKLVKMDVSPKSVKKIKVSECTKLRRINNYQELLDLEILNISESHPQSTEQNSCQRKRKRHEASDTFES